MKKEKIYKHQTLDLNLVKQLRPMFESAFKTELDAIRESGRPDIADERLEFATKQFGNRIHLMQNMKQKTPLFEDAKIFGAFGGSDVKQLFEDFSMPFNITSSGDITNPTPTSTLQGGLWNNGNKSGSGDANTYAFGLQSHIALNCKGFDIMPLVAVDSVKVTLTYTDDIFGGGDLDSDGELPSFLDFSCEGLIDHETIVKELKLKRGVSKVIFASDKADGGIGFEVQFIQMSNARPFFTARILSVGKIDGGVYTKVELTETTFADALVAINAGTTSVMLVDEKGDGNLVEKTISAELKVANTSATRTNLVEATSNRADGGMMSRKEHKKGVNYKINISAMDYQVEMKGRQLIGDTDNLQIKDMAMIGVPVIARLYNAVNNQIFQAIDTDILNHIYALGVQHAYNAYKATGKHHNLYIGVPSNPSMNFADMGVEFKNMLGVDVASEMGIVENTIRTSQFENQSTHISILVARILKVQNFIAYQNRQGIPDFLLAGKGLLSAISAHSKFTISPFNNTLTQTAQLNFEGTLNGMRVYDNNRVEFDDARIVVGRRGTDSDAGAKFVAYDLASSVETIAEGTMSNKIVVWSRYNIADIGYYPELNYYTFVAYNDSQWS